MDLLSVFQQALATVSAFGNQNKGQPQCSECRAANPIPACSRTTESPKPCSVIEPLGPYNIEINSGSGDPADVKDHMPFTIKRDVMYRFFEAGLHVSQLNQLCPPGVRQASLAACHNETVDSGSDSRHPFDPRRPGPAGYTQEMALLQNIHQEESPPWLLSFPREHEPPSSYRDVVGPNGEVIRVIVRLIPKPDLMHPIIIEDSNQQLPN